MHARAARNAEQEVEHAAEQAAARAGVRITELAQPHEAAELADLLVKVWDTGTEHAPMSPDLLGALSFTGQYVATARRDGTLVGGTVGFRTQEDGVPRLHSHITGVLPSEQGRHVGFALKLHQRAWALRHGLAGINWTFDPLVRRNAYFNLTKLGATAARYCVNAYGDMADPINAGEPSDRYVAEWRLLDARATRLPPMPADADIVLDAAADGTPLPVPDDIAPGRTRRLAWIPEDVLALRRREPELAMRWRLALRGVLTTAMADGFVANGMTRDGWYVLERPR
jgi:predicted GNAT superfamily acetyltransferase